MIASRPLSQGERVAFGGQLFTVALIINVTAPPDPGDAPGTYLALRNPSWPKGQMWLIPATAVERLLAHAA